MSMCLTERQSSNKKSEVVRLSREMPQQLAVGLAVHQATRSKNLVNILYGFGMSVQYNRVLRVESQIEVAVLTRMEENGGIFVPPDVVNMCTSHLITWVFQRTHMMSRERFMVQHWRSIRRRMSKMKAGAEVRIFFSLILHYKHVNSKSEKC